jgi:hypothetical protein
LTKVEVDNIKTILSKIEKIKQEHSINIELFIIAAKYDDDDDEELLDMYKNIPEITGVPKENIFRINSYQVLVTHMKKKIFVPESCGQEIKNIKSNLFGKTRGKKKLPVLGKVIDSSELFGTDKFEEDGDWDNLFDKISSFGNELNEFKSKLKADKSIKFLDEIKDLSTYNLESPFNDLNENLSYLHKNHGTSKNYFAVINKILSAFLKMDDIYKLTQLHKYVSTKTYISQYTKKYKKNFLNQVMDYVDKLLKKDINKYISFLPSNVNYKSEDNKYLLLKSYLIANPDYEKFTYVKNTFSFEIEEKYQKVIDVFYMSKAMLRSLMSEELSLLTQYFTNDYKRNIQVFTNTPGTISQHIGVNLFTNCLEKYYNEHDKDYLESNIVKSESEFE